jgi:hypothetical protein
VSKCFHVRFNGGNPAALLLNDQNIAHTDSCTDLGLLTCSNLKWTLHISEKCKKATAVLHMLRRSSPRLPAASKLCLYKSMMLPVISYASSAWFPNIGNKRKLESVQRAACRWILTDYEAPYTTLLQRLNMLPLCFYLEISDLLFLAKITDGYYDVDWADYYTLAPPQRPIRHSHPMIFSIPRSRLAKTSDRFFERTPRLANHISVDICNPTGLKGRLIRLYWELFNTSYDEHNTCTWTARCFCTRHT